MKKILSILLSIVIFIGLYIIIQGQFNINGEPIDQWQMYYGEEVEAVTFPFAINVKEPMIYTFKTTARLNDTDVLVIPQMYGYAIRVFIDDEKLYQVGSFENPSANIWMKTHEVFHLYGDDFEEHNIKIESYALHDIGINAPVYKAKHLDILTNLYLTDLISVVMPFMLFGCYFTSGVFLFSIIFRTRKNAYSEHKKIFVQFGFISMGMAIFTMDGFFWQSVGGINTLMSLRKLFIIGLIVAFYYMIVAHRLTIGERKTNKYLVIVPVLLIIATIITPSMFYLKEMLQIISVFLIIGIVHVLYISFTSKVNINLFTDTLLALTVIHAVLLNFNILEGFYMYYIGLFLFIIDMDFFIAYRFEALHKLNVDLSEEVMTDSLTLAFNRSYLAELVIEPKDSIVFIDLNYFKQYNDHYGHHQGDLLLIRLTEIISEHLNLKDALIRYGGDEFVIVFRDRLIESCEEEIQLILEDLHMHYKEVSFSYGIVEHSDDLMTSVKAADAKMYDMKRAIKAKE